MSSYRLWVSEDHCTLVRIWTYGGEEIAEVASRETPEHTWGAPVKLREEKI
jgi:hypothetical protein